MAVHRGHAVADADALAELVDLAVHAQDQFGLMPPQTVLGVCHLAGRVALDWLALVRMPAAEVLGDRHARYLADTVVGCVGVGQRVVDDVARGDVEPFFVGHDDAHEAGHRFVGLVIGNEVPAVYVIAVGFDRPAVAGAQTGGFDPAQFGTEDVVAGLEIALVGRRARQDFLEAKVSGFHVQPQVKISIMPSRPTR